MDTIENNVLMDLYKIRLTDYIERVFFPFYEL